MQEIGKFVAIIGVVLVAAGVILWRFPGFFRWMGKLPGDISVQKGNFSFYFPVVTCLVISIVLTLLSWLFRR
jgi:membrane protein implicated in regulation of membrane protease activity